MPSSPGVPAISSARSSPLAGLDHHQAQRPLPRPGAQRAERADPLGLVAARGDRAGRLLAAGDHRHDHAGGAEVERLADRERVVGGHAHERDRARPGDRLQHRPSASPARARRAAGRRRRSRGPPAPPPPPSARSGSRPRARSPGRRARASRAGSPARGGAPGFAGGHEVVASCAGSRRPCRRPARTGRGRRGAPGACRRTASRPGRSAASPPAGAPCRAGTDSRTRTGPACRRCAA